MWIDFYCGHCGKNLLTLQESHDSVEFLFNKKDLNCYKCSGKEKLIKIKVCRG